MKIGCKASAIAILAALPPWSGASAQRSMLAAPIGNPADWITPDDYPVDAVRNNRTGRVVAALAVDSTGRVVSCSIRVSSGTTSLDQKTCEIALARGSFNPATDAAGAKIASTYILPVYWKIPNQVAAAIDLAGVPKTVLLDVENVIDEDGKLVSCKTITKSDPAAADPCTRVVIGSATHTSYKLNGRPVRTIVRQRFSWTATPVPAP